MSNTVDSDFATFVLFCKKVSNKPLSKREEIVSESGGTIL